MGTTSSRDGGSSYSPNSYSTVTTWKPRPVDSISQVSYSSRFTQRSGNYAPQSGGRRPIVKYVVPVQPTVIRYSRPNTPSHNNNNYKSPVKSKPAAGSTTNNKSGIPNRSPTPVINYTPTPTPSVVVSTAAMPTMKKKKNGFKVLVERKVRFLGRFYTQALTDATLNKLRAHVRLSNGIKTKLKLSQDGMSSGHKFGTIFKGKIPYEFTPLREIEDIVMDDKTPNMLLVVIRLPDSHYEILAYRVNTNTEGRQFQHTFTDLVMKMDRENPPLQYTLPVEDVESGNWTLRANKTWQRKPVAAVYPHETRMNGSVPNGMSLSDAMYKKIARSQEFNNWSNGRNLESRKYKGGSARDLLDSRELKVRDRRLSSTSDVSVESMKKELLNLSREVEHLKTMVADGSARNSDRPIGEDSVSVVSTASRPGRLVDVQAGVVKARVSDHRHPAEARQHSARHDGPIRVVYKREGEDELDLERPPSRDATTNTLPHQSYNYPTHSHRNGRMYSRSARQSIERDAAPVYATVQKKRSHSPMPHTTQRARTYSAPDYAPPQGGRVYRSRSVDMPRFRILKPARSSEFDNSSVYSSPGGGSSGNFVYGQRVTRVGDHKNIYYATMTPDLNYSTMSSRPRRSLSSSRHPDDHWY